MRTIEEYVERRRQRAMAPTRRDLRTAGLSELSVRIDELAAHPPPGPRVLVVENEVTYLARARMRRRDRDLR